MSIGIMRFPALVCSGPERAVEASHYLPFMDCRPTSLQQLECFIGLNDSIYQIAFSFLGSGP